MAELEDWTPQDEVLLRGAMTTLRGEVEAVPLAEARFVRARGARLRRQRRVVWSASAAAAAVVIATVVSAQLGQHPGLPVTPATTSGTPTVTTTTTNTAAATSATLLDVPGALPLPQEWAQSLGVRGQVRDTPITATDHECLTTVPLGQTRREELTVPGSTVSGGQTRFAISTALDPTTVAEGMASDIARCTQPHFVVTAVHPSTTSATSARLFSYTAGDAGSGWFVIAVGRRDVTLIQVVDSRPGPSAFTPAQVSTLATIATTRLARYGTGTPVPATTTGSGPRALDEQMPVAGVAPLISSRLFVAASQWSSPGLTAGQPTTAGPAQPEGGLGGVVQCETSAYLSGVAGRYGIVRIRAGQGVANYVGVQRVRLFEDVDAASLVAADLARSTSLLAHGCTFGNGTVRATPGPSQGTYRLDTVFADGSPTVSAWVGVTAQHTQGAVSTVVITKAAHPGQAFAELDRLLALARQK